MMDVHIYLWIHPKAPRARNLEYKYILVCAGARRSGGGIYEDETYNRAVLKTLIAAMSRMVKPAMITIHTDCTYLANGHEHLPEWIRNGWTRAKGQKLKNDDLWRRIHDLEKIHGIRCQVDADVNLIFNGESPS